MAPRTTVDECNREGREVFFDADVLICALRRQDSPEARLLTRVSPTLRRIAATTRFEVSFARRGDQAMQGDVLGRLKENLQQLRDWRFVFDDFRPEIGREFDGLFSKRGHLRGAVQLGDSLLARAAYTRNRSQRCAIATRNASDFDEFGVHLAADFLPPP